MIKSGENNYNVSYTICTICIVEISLNMEGDKTSTNMWVLIKGGLVTT